MADSHVTGSCRLRKVPFDRLFCHKYGSQKKETLDLQVFHSVVNNINYWTFSKGKIPYIAHVCVRVAASQSD